VKLLCFSDIHCSDHAIRQIVQRSAEVDVVIGAGDFCNMHQGLEETIDKLSAITCDAVFVAGNSETFESLEACCKPFEHLHPLHGNGLELHEHYFYGVGGGIPVTPFGSWSWDFNEDEGRQLLKNCPRNAILVTHSPPYGCLDITSRGQHVGSRSVRETIETLQPLLCVCGHIHESSGQATQLAKTTVINAGPRLMTTTV
jgi:Icc-related predicted phosphoesterase